MVGGVLSFAAVIFLTCLCEGMDQEGSLLPRRSAPVGADSIDAGGDPDTLGPGQEAGGPSGADQGQDPAAALDGPIPKLSAQSDHLDSPTTMVRTPSSRGTLWVMEPNEIDDERAQPLEGLDPP